MDAVTSWFTSVPLDWFILVIFCTLVVLDALRGSTERAVAISLAFPLAAFAIGALSTAAFAASLAASTPVIQAGVFLALVVGFFVLIYRMLGYGETGRPFQAILAGVGATVIAISVWLSVDALQSLWDFGPAIEAVFGEAYRLWWLTGGLVLVAVARK